MSPQVRYGRGDFDPESQDEANRRAAMAYAAKRRAAQLADLVGAMESGVLRIEDLDPSVVSRFRAILFGKSNAGA